MCWKNSFILFTSCITLALQAGCSRQSGTINWPEGECLDAGKNSRKSDTSSIEILCIAAGLIDVHSLDSSILVDLKYASEDNFLKKNLYGNFRKCYLQPEVAQKIADAQKILKTKHPEKSLLVWDAARPLSVQKAMWKVVKPPPGLARGSLVSNPARGSLHNFGCAVDVTIADENGNPLDMGTGFDCFEEIAWPVREQKLLKDAKLTPEQVTNRKLLRSVMYSAGFWNIQTEWWHFNAMRREVAAARFTILP